MDPNQVEQIGLYRVVRFIDAGAFAWVFEVVDPKFAGRRLALKMLKPEAAQGEEFRRFESEARLLAEIDHPSVVTIFDFGIDETTNNHYYVMNYVDGSTLKERLKHGYLSFEEAGSIFIDLLDGLERLHQLGIIHRDIKPANILIGTDGRARLADLGIARVQSERGQTKTGMAVGTALYMSPEQARGREVDSRSDIFSLGLTLYETLTGDVIYDHVESIDSTSGMDVLMYIGSLVHSNQPFDINFTGDPPVSERAENLIRRALFLDPEDRFASATEMKETIREALRPEALPPTVTTGVPRGALIGGAGLAVVIALLAHWGFVIKPQMDRDVLLVDASAKLEVVRAQAEQAVAITSGILDLDPGPPGELIETVEDEQLRADSYLEDGANDLEAGELKLAQKGLERAQSAHLATCDLWANQFLNARAEADASTLQARAQNLLEGGASEMAAEPWGRLLAFRPRLNPPAETLAGCPAAAHQLDRIQAATIAGPAADEVSTTMDVNWPRALDEGYQKAVTARLVATAESSDAMEFRVALKEAKLLLLKGSRARRAGRRVQAQAAYMFAERAFIDAGRILPAALARSEAARVRNETIGDGVGDVAVADASN
jgi:tRNA A-37 threonylcarbamoyl transferase component Bud32